MPSSEHPALATFREHVRGSAIMLDLDGTLAPIVARPELVSVSEETRLALFDLVERVRCVAVISGRPSQDIATIVGVPGTVAIGLYGRERPGDDDEDPVSDGLIEEALTLASSFPGSQVEPKGAGVALHYRNVGDPERVRRRLEPEVARIASRWNMRVLRGKRVLELAPGGTRDKGDAVRELVEDVTPAAALYAGDDVADLPAFDALTTLAPTGLITLRVGVAGPEAPTALAEHVDLSVAGPRGLAALLRALPPG